MKKFTALFLAFFYLGTATGVTLHLHYCMGEMVGIELATPHTDLCESCGMEKGRSAKDNCCKDEFKKIQTDDSRHTATDAFKTIAPFVALPLQKQVYQFIAAAGPSVAGQHPLSNGPPRTSPVAVYILNCTYLI